MRLGFYRLKIEGFNQMRLISELTKSGIKLYDIERKKTSVMSASVAKKDSGKTFAILEKMCYNYSVIERSDVKSLLASTASRAGLIIGALVFSAVLTLFYGFIWRIDVSGNEKVDELIVIRALKEQGIAIGNKKKNLDKNSVRNIINSIDGILESSVQINGARMQISVIEDTDFEPSPSVSDTDILSRYDATVTRLITTSGTALVARGDIVKKGDPLIGAFITDAEGNVLMQNAVGRVYGMVVFSATKEFYSSVEVLERTGKKYSATDYLIFKKTIKGKHKHGFESFDTQVQTSYVFENLFVPLKMTRTVYYETALTTVERDVEAEAQALKQQLINELAINAGAQEIQTSHILIKAENNIYRLTVYVQAEMVIGQS